MAALRPRPEPRSLLAAAPARLAIVVSLAFASLVPVRDALAQAGAGAERYEVTITPPRRPGSEPAAEAASPAAAADAAEPQSAPAAAPADPAAPIAADGAAAPIASAPASPRPAASLPLRTLQVGAFRQSQSATTLRDKLAASFPDVSVVEVQSGGEPLYRVYVGQLPRSAALDELRKRLVAAGHPAFEVPAPTVSVAD